MWLQDVVTFGVELVSAIVGIRAIWRVHPDVLLVRQSSFGVLAPLLRAITRTPIILEVDAHLPRERGYQGAKFSRMSRLTLNLALRFAASILVHSHPIERWLAGEGVSPDRIVTYLNPPPDNLFDISERSDHEAVVVGFAGSMAPWHRVDTLLEAVQIAASQPGSPAIRLILVGDGREGSKIKKLIEGLGVSETVCWRGQLSEGAVAREMASWDVGVLPWTLETGCPMKLLEYAAAGLAVVAPNLPNVTELLQPPRECLVIERPDSLLLADILLELAVDKRLRDSLARNARRRVKEYTIASQLGTCLNTWERMGLPTPRQET
jgi:glycosyltransferase involved in cell wall biosynthesis